MFWIQFSTFVMFSLLIFAVLAQHLPEWRIGFVAGQHAGGGEGDYTVWHLIADIEAENAETSVAGQRRFDHEFPEIPPRFPESDPDESACADDQHAGRHHLREEPPDDPVRRIS